MSSVVQGRTCEGQPSSCPCCPSGPFAREPAVRVAAAFHCPGRLTPLCGVELGGRLGSGGSFVGPPALPRLHPPSGAFRGPRVAEGAGPGADGGSVRPGQPGLAARLSLGPGHRRGVLPRGGACGEGRGLWLGWGLVIGG